MDRKNEIKTTVEKEILQIYGQLQYSSGKARLAKLRNSIGKTDLVETYPFLFEILPENLQGRGKYLSDEEKAVICSLQFYALLQQGKTECVYVRGRKNENLATSLSQIRRNEESAALDRRFNSMILADTEEEFLTHLRYMLQLFKGKAQSCSVDFGQLAEDIYRFIHWENGKEEIRLSWSREYYKIYAKGEENDD